MLDENLMPNMNKLIDLHNAARLNLGLLRFFRRGLLIKNDMLMKYAQNHAKWMAEHNKLEHSSMKDMMKLGFGMVGENIARGQDTEESVMNSWINSIRHRKNILNRKYNAIGCGVFLDSKGKIYWCVCFGSFKI